jgi:uncharacterized protein
MAYYVYVDTASQWRWRLKADNGRIIADSGQGYANQQDCLHGINLVKQSFNVTVYTA